MHTVDIYSTYITYHIQIYIQSGYLFFYYLSLWLLSSLQEHADSVYGCVSDRMAGRLSTLLFEGAIFGWWRSSWTIPRTRRPRTRYDDAATVTMGWNRIHPDLPYTILHSCIHTYMHACMHIWLFLMCRKWRRRYTPTYFSHPCIQVRMSFMHTYMQHTVVYVCMYACVYYDIKAVSAWGMQGHQTERIFYKRSWWWWWWWWWCNTWIYGVCGSLFSLGLVVSMYVFIWSLLITISTPSLCLG
jgi:hypothetical protein